MKTTKVYFDCIRIAWDCMECGLYNVGEIVKNTEFKNNMPVLVCHRCKAKRKANLTVVELVKTTPKYPFSKERRKKMGKISEKYAHKWVKESKEKKQKYIEELKNEKRKKK